MSRDYKTDPIEVNVSFTILIKDHIPMAFLRPVLYDWCNNITITSDGYDEPLGEIVDVNHRIVNPPDAPIKESITPIQVNPKVVSRSSIVSNKSDTIGVQVNKVLKSLGVKWVYRYNDTHGKTIRYRRIKFCGMDIGKYIKKNGVSSIEQGLREAGIEFRYVKPYYNGSVNTANVYGVCVYFIEK